MTIAIAGRGLLLALVGATVVGCGPSDEAKRKADSAVAAAAQTKAITQAGEVISARREAQLFLDSARAAFVAKHASVAAKRLSDAAAFTRRQADTATGAAKKALVGSADELDRLSTRIARGAVKSVNTLDYAFARTHLAEARFHHERALAAWHGPNTASAGAEIVMATDHLERAISDARQTASAETKSGIADARSLATKLARGASVAPTEVDSALATLDKEINGLATTVAKLKK
jgi:hypothetical protein